MKSIIRIMLTSVIFIMGGEDKGATVYIHSFGGETRVSSSFYNIFEQQNMTFPYCHEVKGSQVSSVKLVPEFSHRSLEIAQDPYLRACNDMLNKSNDMERKIYEQKQKLLNQKPKENNKRYNYIQRILDKAQTKLSKLKNDLLMDLRGS